MSEQISFLGSKPTGAKAAKPQSVSQVTRYLARLLDEDPALQNVWVQGEISNYKRAASGHLYFSLKDANAQLPCVMWKTAAGRLDFEPRHGDLVVATGRLKIYEPQGHYQLYVDTLQAAGLGDLHQQFELLKARLAEEGLFDSERKRPLPLYPSRIGLVTSPNAAGFQDMLNIFARRFPAAELILSPTLVQGTAAPPQIIAALARLNRYGAVQVIILARGGGSLEDLWCFNDEGLVRAVAASPIPVVTGVGHEIDFTLVDFAADYRAPTPSAAAEKTTPDRADLAYKLRDYADRLTGAIEDRLHTAKEDLAGQKRLLNLVSPADRLAQARQRLDQAGEGLLQALETRQAAARQQVASFAQRLESASPRALLARGYVMVSRPDGGRVSAAQSIKEGEALRLQFHDGQVSATVDQISKNERPQ
jgi:exodeoxyribonuclease VII large subunit